MVNHAAREAHWNKARQLLLSVDAPETDEHDLLAQVWAPLQDDIRSDAAALALLTLGHPHAARDRLRAQLPSEHLDLRALLLARFAAWTADIEFTREVWTAHRELVDAISTASVLIELANTAESIGERNDASHMRERAVAAHPHGLDALVASPSADHRSTNAVRRVLHFVHSILGAKPDATRNRLVLQPRLPDACSRLRVTNLRLGPAAIQLEYHRDPAAPTRAGTVTHTFVLTPLEGMVPIRVVFEPAIPGQTIHNVTVDGTHGSLDVRRSGDRLLCPVQIVLDNVRTLEVSTM